MTKQNKGMTEEQLKDFEAMKKLSADRYDKSIISQDNALGFDRPRLDSKPKWEPRKAGTFNDNAVMPVYYQELIMLNNVYGSKFTYHNGIRLNDMFRSLIAKFELFNKCFNNLKQSSNIGYKDITKAYGSLFTNKEKMRLMRHLEKSQINDNIKKIALPIYTKSITGKIIIPVKMSQIELYEELPFEGIKCVNLIEIIKEDKKQYRICL